MNVEILDHELVDKGFLKAKYDVKIIYNSDKWEIIRNLALFIKNDRKWVNWPSVKKDDKWLPQYEREPSWPSSEVLNAILDHFSQL